MWGLDHKEGRVPKNWYFRTVLLEKTLEGPLDSKEIKPVNLKGNQFWIFIGRTDAKAEAPMIWPPNANSWLIRKEPDAGKDWGQKKEEVTEDEMVGWHHWLNTREFEQTQGNSEEKPGMMQSMGVWKSQTQLGNWIATTEREKIKMYI